jgi:flagellar hook assembly protein FlgD
MGRQGQVQFFLPAAAQIRLAIYDVRGRLVRTLAQGSYSPGLHSVPWEPRADDGSMLSQGIYFARLDVDGRRFTRRFVVVR